MKPKLLPKTPNNCWSLFACEKNKTSNNCKQNIKQRTIATLNSLKNSLKFTAIEVISNTDARTVKSKNLVTLNGSYVFGFAAKTTTTTPSSSVLLDSESDLNISE